MKFHVCSHQPTNGKPCASAYRAVYTRVDRREALRPESIPAFHGCAAEWYADGHDHRIEDDMIARNVDDMDWFIEVDDLDHFTLTHGPIIVRHCVEDADPDAQEIQLLEPATDSMPPIAG